MAIDDRKRIFLIKKWYKLQNITLVKRAWRTKYKFEPVPHYSTIKNYVTKFEKNGSVANSTKVFATRVERRETAKNRVAALIKENPRLSTRKLGCDADISHGLARLILRDDLMLYPYSVHVRHELKAADYARRLNFADWVVNKAQIPHDSIVCTDEAWFCLTEAANKQNDRLWLDSTPEDAIEAPLHDQKVMVWCAISASKLYGPYFFETTVNGDVYLDMLRKFFWPKISRTRDYKSYYFQQDGATPHWATNVVEWLTEKFDDKFIDKSMWPARSPDLNPCDYFLWGYLKSKVYRPIPKTIEELKANIVRECKNIDKTFLNNTFLNFKKRCNLVIDANGGHFENK